MNIANIITDNPWVVLLISLWVLPWKGYALWKAAKRDDKYWFVALLVINTLGILEILYIFVFFKRSDKKG